MKFRIINIAFINLLLLCSCNLFAQEFDDEAPAKIVPPSPEAAALGSYGSVPVGLYSGSAQFNVPLYTVQGKNLSVPISLNYSTNGILIEDISTWVGAGWTLDAGGVITRTVRGEEDEFHVNETIPQLNSFCMLYEEARMFDNDGDLEYDTYSFNFMGHSGTFIIVNNQIKLIEKSDLIFENVTSLMNQFIVTDGQGVKYYFGLTDVPGENAAIEYSQSNTGPSIKTAWYLTKITHWTGENMFLTYDVGDTTYNYNSDYSQIMRNGLGAVQQIHPQEISLDPYFPCLTCDNSAGSVIYNMTHNTTKHKAVYLKSIYNQYDKVDFIKASRTSGYGNFEKLKKLTSIEGITKKITFDITEAQWYRLYLDKVKIKSLADTENEVYSFEYNKLSNNWTPDRGGFYRDYWGYYNARSNSNLVQGNHGPNPDVNVTSYGALKKITYPTGGFSTIAYEPNSSKTYGSYSNCNEITTGWIVGSLLTNSSSPAYFEAIPFIVNNAQEVTFNLKGEYFPDLAPAINSAVAGQANFVLYNSANDEAYFDEFLYGNMDKTVTKQLPAGEYYLQIAVKSDKYHVRSSYSLCANYDNTTPVLNLSGGVRVRQIDSYAKIDQLSFSKRYEYAEEQFAKPITEGYISNVTDFNEQECLNGMGQNPFIGNSASFFYPYCVFKIRQNPIGFTDNKASIRCFYGKVTEKNLNGSIAGSEIVHKFKSCWYSTVPLMIFNHTEEYDSNLYGNPPSFYNVSGSPFEYQTMDYKIDENNNKILVKNTKLSYEYNTDSVDLFPSYITQRITKLRNLLVNHIYIYNGLECTYGDLIARQMNVWKYYHVASFQTLKKKEVTEYFASSNPHPDELVTTTNYFYENANHKKITKEETDTSYKIAALAHDSKKKTIQYFYPSDILFGARPFAGGAFSSTELQNITSLVATNRIVPIQVETYSENGEPLAVQRTIYKSWNVGSTLLNLPEKIQGLKGVYNSTSNPLEDRIIYSKYSPSGKILEARKKDGTPISYFYGYSDRYLVAAIENATYVDLASHISAINEAITNSSDIALRMAFANLRNELGNAQVTSYTYKPLVGMSSMTDPKNYTVYYFYDEFHRLRQVKNNTGKILTENEYHFRQQN